MDKLDKLKQQKKEIEAEIRKLTHQEVTVGRCKFHLEHYATAKPDEWVVTYTSRAANRKDDRNKRILSCYDRDKAIETITDVINDLTELQKVLREKDDWSLAGTSKNWGK